MNEGRTGGWDIRLQCTVCGFRHRKDRYERTDGGPMGHELPSTVETECSNCTAETGDYTKPIVTTHFVDIASDAEISEKRYEGYNQKPKCDL